LDETERELQGLGDPRKKAKSEKMRRDTSLNWQLPTSNLLVAEQFPREKDARR